MRADRLLSIIWLLRTDPKLSSRELAERLEVSRRTIMRDIDALSAAGVPVYCKRGPRGGVRLLPGYRTDVSGLSSEESRALFAAVTTWGAESLGLGEALASGLRKLLAAVPESSRHRASEVSARIAIDPRGWLPQTEVEQVGATFQTVQQAVFAQQLLRITYRHKTRDSTTQSVVEPHGLISAGRQWYLCSTLNEDLLFTKLSRISEATMLDQPCILSRHIDVARAWKEHRERFLETFASITATAWIRETRWSDVHEWAIQATEIETEQTPPGLGWSSMKLKFVDHLHAITIMLRLGPDALIESPEHLRHDFVNYLETTLMGYNARG